MPRHSRSTLPALALAAVAVVAAARPASAQDCKLDYQRADNMWAAFGRPDGTLGVESITVPAGQTRVFVTDWKYEKQRNDGTNFYGSHLRVATNRGTGSVALLIKGALGADLSGMVGGVMTNVLKLSSSSGVVTLKPGERREFRADLAEVRCTVGAKS